MEAAVETAAVDEAAVDDRRTGVQADGGRGDGQSEWKKTPHPDPEQSEGRDLARLTPTFLAS
jgi:hypothetical protein